MRNETLAIEEEVLQEARIRAGAEVLTGSFFAQGFVSGPGSRGLRRRPGATTGHSGKRSQRGPPAWTTSVHLRATKSFRDGRDTCARMYGAGALRTLARALLF